MTDQRERLLDDAQERFGIDTTPELTERVLATSVPTELTVSCSESEPARNVSVAEDPENAFVYRFDLSGSSGPLDDLTVAVKDNLFVAGVPLTCGSKAFELVPDRHAGAIERMLEAGANLVGSTNMDEFAYYTTGETSAHGPTENPAINGHVPGGSSSGSGAAVAANHVDVALGSDTGGSIRIPASFCGVVGFKPTYGTVPRSGFVSLSPSLDHIGPLAGTVRDAARTLDVLQGRDPADPSTWFSRAPKPIADRLDADLGSLSIAAIEESFDHADSNVVEGVSVVRSQLEGEGHSVSDVSIPDYTTATVANATLTGMEFTTLFENNGHVYGNGTGASEQLRRAIVDAKEDGSFGDIVQRRLLTNYLLKRETDGEPYVTAQRIRSRFIGHLAELLDEFDALLTPTTPMTAPRFGEIDDERTLLRTLLNTGPFNAAGTPALSVPCGPLDEPIGVQLVGSWYDELTVARLGRTVEEAVDRD